MSEELTLRQVGSTEVIHWARLTVQGLPCERSKDVDAMVQEFSAEPEESKRAAYLAWHGGRPVARLRLKQEDGTATTWAIGFTPEPVAPELDSALVRAVEDLVCAWGARRLLCELQGKAASAFAAAGYRTQRVRVNMRGKLIRRPVICDLPMHPISLDDEDQAQAMAHLYHESYLGTIDDEGEDLEEALAEVHRTRAGEYGPFLPACSFALKDGGRLAGAVLVTQDEDAVLLAEVMVHPRYRGRGYARPLIQAAMNASLDAGWQEMTLTVTLGNVPAEGLYRRMGFREKPGCEWYYLVKELARGGDDIPAARAGS